MEHSATVHLMDGRLAGDARLAQYLSWLGPDELARHARFVRAERRRQFVLGRGLVREALAPLLRTLPALVLLEERTGFGPRCLLPGLSIAHSGPWIACAVSASTALGLDVEIVDETRDLAALAAQAFDVERCAQLAGSGARAFYHCWSEQEARFKVGVENPQCVAIDHAELSIVLCSAAPVTVSVVTT